MNKLLSSLTERETDGISHRFLFSIYTHISKTQQMQGLLENRESYYLCVDAFQTIDINSTYK